MGIKDLRLVLKRRNSACFGHVALDDLKGKRLAIDMLNWFFSYLCIVFKKIAENMSDPLDDIPADIVLSDMIDEWMEFNNKLMRFGIIPLWIWDGISKGNKTVTKIDRRVAREKTKLKKDTLKEQLEKMNILERDPALVEAYRRLISNSAYMSYKDMDVFKEFTYSSGIPTIEAVDEAENLASSLAVEGKVGAVWSADTDTYALGAPIVVKKFICVEGKLCFEAVFVSIILKELEMTQKQFLDFCILLGTDFNDRIYRMGPTASLKAIKKYECLENYEKDFPDNAFNLDFREVRKQLTAYTTNIIEQQLAVKRGVDMNFLKKFTNSVGLISFHNNIAEMVDPLEVEEPFILVKNRN
jgi:flap endonuclease-1